MTKSAQASLSSVAHRFISAECGARVAFTVSGGGRRKRDKRFLGLPQEKKLATHEPHTGRVR